jgi:hypothetical protein
MRRHWPKQRPLLSGKADLIAGGTDLIGRLKDNILLTYPEGVINKKTITPSLDYIKKEGSVLEIGATTRLADIAANDASCGRGRCQTIDGNQIQGPDIEDVGETSPSVRCRIKAVLLWNAV